MSEHKPDRKHVRYWKRRLRATRPYRTDAPHDRRYDRALCTFLKRAQYGSDKPYKLPTPQPWVTYGEEEEGAPIPF